MDLTTSALDKDSIVPLPSPSTPFRSLLIVCTGILAILIVGVLQLARAVLTPLALAILLTFILAPLVAILQGRQLNRTVSVLLVGVVAFLVLGSVGLAVSAQLQSLSTDLPRYQDNITQKIAGLRESGKGTLLENVQKAIDAITKAASMPDPANATPAKEPLLVRVERSGFTQLETVASSGVELMATSGLVIVLVVFMLIKREDLRDRLIRLLGHGNLTYTTKALNDAGQRISRFLFTQVLVNAGFGVALGLGLFLIGVPYALLWAFLAGVLRFVPYLGSSLTAFLLLTFSVAAFPEWTQPLLVLGLFVVLELGFANVIEPLLIGHSTGVSPLSLLVAAAFWTWLWGPVGLLLSTPLTVCLVVLGKHVPQLEFFDVLLGDERALTADVTYYQRLLARDQDEATQIVLAHVRAQSLEQVYDDVLIPALSHAKRDREREVLNQADEEFIFQVTREIVQDLGERQPAAALKEDGLAPPNSAAAGPPKTRILGLPGRDEGDRLALEMLRQVLDPAIWDLEMMGSEALTGELVAAAEQRNSALICISSLPPGGLAHARYLCKRLRSRFPAIKIAVGRWGLGANLESNQEELRAAGANHVETSLANMRALVTTLLPVPATLPTPPPDRPE